MPLIQLDDPDSTLHMVRDSIAGLATGIDGTVAFRRRRTARDALDPDTWSAMAAAGWLGLSLPEAAGGMGLGPAELAILFEGLGRALLTEPFATLALFPGTLLSAVSGGDAMALAAGLVEGTQILPVLWQNDRGARQALQVESAAELSGSAHFVAGARRATGFLVLAVHDGQSLLVHVPADMPGLGLSQRLAVDGAMLGVVTLERIDLDACTILGRGSVIDAAFDSAIAQTRLALAAELAGIASRALEATVAFTSERVQFGRPIAANQVVQHRLVDMWAEAEFACAAVANAVEALSTGTSGAAAQAILAAKARAGDAATSITRKAVHLHGAMGFTDQCDIGLYLKRAISLNATLGQPEDLRMAFLDAERAA